MTEQILNFEDLPFFDPNDPDLTPEELQILEESIDRFVSDGSDITVIYVPGQEPEPKQN